jgi:hypothetical protein
VTSKEEEDWEQRRMGRRGGGVRGDYIRTEASSHVGERARKEEGRRGANISEVGRKHLGISSNSP